MPREYNTKDFIEKSNKVHNGKYDYSLVKYTGSKNKVTIICLVHGMFEQIPYNHLYGKGCSKCAGNINYDSKQFIEKAKKVHGDKYDYSKVNYIKSYIEVTIVCPKHGEFKQKPVTHLQGHNCKTCALEDSKKYPESLLYLISKSRNCIFGSYKRRGFTKKSYTSKILGCTWNEFKNYLEDNPYGFKINQEGLDLDHITPISSAKSEEDIIKLNHYTNFQLLPSVYNRWIKSCKLFNKDHFEEWLLNNKNLV